MGTVKSIMILCLAFFLSNISLANSYNMDQNLAFEWGDTEREISMKEAPMLVQKAVKGDAYKGWKATKIFHVIKDGKEYYKVLFEKGEEEMYQNFHKDGTLKPKVDR